MGEQNLAGKVVLVTGANSGIGKATAMQLARIGATTILACRHIAKARQTQEEIRRVSCNDAVCVVELDLGDLRSVDRCASEVVASANGIDVLINNAGATFPSRALTPQGFEQTFAVNYLGHYVLTRLLLHHLRRKPQARVISVSSNGHKFVKGIRWDDLTFERRYSTTAAYANAKLAQVLFTRELAHRYGETGVFAHAVHPGFVGSNFYRSAGSGFSARALGLVVRWFAKSPEQGAETTLYLASSDDAICTNGGYWARCEPASPSKAATDDDAAKRLWDLSQQLVADAGMALPQS